MTEINRIYVNSSLTVENGYSNTLCFIDGSAATKDRYTLANNEISIYKEAQDYLSIFYNTNSSSTYYFEKILNEYGVIVFGKDSQGKELIGLREDNVLIFIDGTLLSKSEYQILDSKNVALFVMRDDMIFHNIIIYVSNSTLINGVLTDPMNINVDDVNNPNNPENKIGYSKDNTLIFMNGKYLSPNLIDTINGYTFVNFVPTAADKFEYYKLNNETISVNFEATKGITTYGPVDDYNTKVPNLYDSSVIFDDLAKVIVDDIRPGFFICEKDRAGRLLVVDTNYETSKIKTITLQAFSTKYYTKDEYYLEVPEAKSIASYLSDYDKNHALLPEILNVFQRVLLDELHDEVERIKNIRNVRKVNSDHIYKLLRLLGMDLDIKHLNVKQMQEALDELTEFYRVAGTKQSLNYFNIVQDNTKLINVKPLYTFHKKRGKKEENKIYSYSYKVYNDGETTYGGSGYESGEKYKVIDETGEDTGIVIDVKETGPNGSIIDGGFSANLHEGKKPYSILPLQITTNSIGATLSCSSFPYMYSYTSTIKSETTWFAWGDNDQGGGSMSPLYYTKSDTPSDGDYVYDFNLVYISDHVVKEVRFDSETGVSYLVMKNPITGEEYTDECSPTKTPRNIDDDQVKKVKGFQEGDILVSPDPKYKDLYVEVDHVDNDGCITEAHLNATTGTTSYSNATNVLLQPQTSQDNLQLVINAKTQTYDEVFRSYEAGAGSFIADDNSLYRITFSGAGGAGGSADTAFGSTADAPAGDGYSGEKRVITVACTKGQKIDFQIGSGGKSSVAMAGGTCKYGEKGIGSTYKENNISGDGQTGKNRSRSMSGERRHRTWHSDYYCYLINGNHYHSHSSSQSSVAASGSGGGGSSVTCGGTTWTAAGGNGGSATCMGNAHKSEANEVLAGGIGGYKGSTIPNGKIELYCWIDEPNQQNFIYLKTNNVQVGTKVYKEDGTTEIGVVDTISSDGKRIYLRGQSTTPYIRWAKGDQGVGARGGHRNWDDNTFTSGAGEDGYIIIEKITQYYGDNPELRNNHDIYVDPGTELKTTDGRFTIVVNSVDSDHKISDFTLKPQYGTVNPVYVIDSNGKMTFTKTYNVISNPKEATLSISQDIILYNYKLQIKGSEGAYKTGQTLTYQYNPDTIFNITTENVIEGTIQPYEDGGFDYMPKQGSENINFEDAILITKQGEGARIQVISTADVETQNIEREYVDFYLPEEQGAEWKKEYRFPILDYGYVNQGSPSSPKPWEPGDPDIDYGLVSEGSPNSPYPSDIYGTHTETIIDDTGIESNNVTKTTTTKGPIGNPDIDYGLVSEKIKGKWVEWLEWDRPADLYPTNHVEVEVNILSVEDYDQAIARFYKQFYSLASTVLYIHRLVTVYNFGNNTAANITEDKQDTSGSMILMGFMTAQPFDESIYTLTSDPSRQDCYKQEI